MSDNNLEITTGRPEEQTGAFAAIGEKAPAIFAATRMESLASENEVADFVRRHPTPFMVFAESRENAIRRFDGLPAHWLREPGACKHAYTGEARPGEYFVFQLAVYAPAREVRGLTVTSSELSAASAGGRAIPSANISCFAVGGRDYRGQVFQKEVNVPAGRVQPLWMGVQVPADARGEYGGVIEVGAEGLPATAIAVAVTVSGTPLADAGEGQEERLSRLRWLDSTIGQDGAHVPEPFHPLVRGDRTLALLGRSVDLADHGMPRAIRSFFQNGNQRIGSAARPLLRAPFRFVVERGGRSDAWVGGGVRFTHEQAGRVEWEAGGGAPDGLEIGCRGELEFDGYLRCRVTVRATRDLPVDDIRLEIDHAAEASDYLLGLGRDGGTCPAAVDWKWDALRWHDGYWLGAVEGGMKLRFSDDQYRSPLVNCYYNFRPLVLPRSWNNEGRGGIRLARTDEGVGVVAYSGGRTLRAGEELSFNFEVWITPFKPIDPAAHWFTRFFHPHMHSFTPGRPDGYDVMDFAKVRADGANTVNVHHAVGINPIINYPYNRYSFHALRAFVEKAHRTGVQVCLYYTTRELTVHIPEFWAFFSLNGEVICDGPGPAARPVTNREGPHPWMVEHLREHFIPAWAEVIKSGELNGVPDFSVITAPDSRLENYFLEGLRYLLERCPIDGLYLDDASLSREGFQRVRRIFEAFGKPDAVIDFHAWNASKPFQDFTFGFATPTYRDLHNFPYFTRLWLGEGFDYEGTPPDYWLTEISGIPFGLMGEMLQKGGNPWRGLLYGMTNRLGWYGDPRAVWRVWDELRLKQARMTGYWEKACPVRTTHPEVYATVYETRERVVVALASWHAHTAVVTLKINADRLGGRRFTRLVAPAVEGFQSALRASLDEPLTVEPGKGLLVLLE